MRYVLQRTVHMALGLVDRHFSTDRRQPCARAQRTGDGAVDAAAHTDHEPLLAGLLAIPLQPTNDVRYDLLRLHALPAIVCAWAVAQMCEAPFTR